MNSDATSDPMRHADDDGRAMLARLALATLLALLALGAAGSVLTAAY
jgi:hypothetical protein